MKKLHPTYGIRIDFSEITDRNLLIELIKQYSLVVIDNATCTNTKENFMSYSTSLGQPLPIMHREFLDSDIKTYKNTNLIQYFDKNGTTGVDDFEYDVGKNFLTNNQAWHQDASAYSGKSNQIGFATVKLKNKMSIDKTADTAFSSSYTAFNNFSQEFKEFLRGLTLEFTSWWSADKNTFLEKIVMDNIKSRDFNKMLKDIVGLKSKVDKKYIRPLVGVSPWGFEYLDLDPSSINSIVELTEKESKNLIKFLTDNLTDYQYCYNHVWEENQLVVYDNTRLLHRYLDNASGLHTRNYWRVQVELDSIIGNNV